MPLDTLHNARLDPELKALADVPLSRILGTPPTTMSSQDWNDLITPGYHNYLMRGSQTNGPGDTDYYIVEVLTYGGADITQIGKPFALVGTGFSRNSLVIRNRYNGVWQPWRRIIAQEDKPSFNAYSNYTSNTGVSGVQVWTNVRHNIGNCYNVSNGRFTAPIAGRYLWDSCLLSRQHTSTSSTLRYNGSSYNIDEDSRASNNFGSVHLHMTINMSAGDYLELHSNGDNYGTLYCWMSCSLL